MIKPNVIGLFFVVTLLGCREHSLEQFPNQTPAQRVSSMTKLYLAINPTDNKLDTVLVNGTTYSVTSIDSMSFSYDAQQRLIRHQYQQITTNKDKPFQAPDQTYLYQNGYMHQGASRYRLDSTQRRVLSYTQQGFGYTDFDSLRSYSSEGLLVSVLRTILTNKPSFQPVGPPTVLATVEGGNITKVEEYDYSTKALNRVTRYTYDNKHFGPLAAFTFRGESSRHALLRETITRYYGTSYDTYTYAYINQYDRQNRLTRQLQQDVSNSSNPKSLVLTKFCY
jgi:hypothetical protein